MAFGTGHHATTATALRLLVDVAKTRPKWSMADLGCGSGIRAIAAAKLGATRVWGCDYDPQAMRISKENALRNEMPKIRLTKLDVPTWQPKETWDIFAISILHDVLEGAVPQIDRAVAPGGILMLSGILHTQAACCIAACKKAGFLPRKIIRKGKWVSVMGRANKRAQLLLLRQLEFNAFTATKHRGWQLFTRPMADQQMTDDLAFRHACGEVFDLNQDVVFEEACFHCGGMFIPLTNMGDAQGQLFFAQAQFHTACIINVIHLQAAKGHGTHEPDACALADVGLHSPRSRKGDAKILNLRAALDFGSNRAAGWRAMQHPTHVGDRDERFIV